MAQLVHCFQVETEIGILVSVEGGKPEDAEKNPQSKDKYNDKLNLHGTPGPGIEPGPR